MLNIGIDIGGTNIKIGVVDTTAKKILKKDMITFDKKGTPQKIFSDIKVSILDMLNDLNIKPDLISDIGVAVPGSIDSTRGVVISAYNLDFKNLKIKSAFEELFPKNKIKIINDANAATLAEYKLGALQNTCTSILFTIGTGLGGGMIINGKLFEGGNKNGVEFGHIIIDKNGEMCTCGNRGCAETLCSASFIAKKGAEYVKSNFNSLIYSKVNGDIYKINAKAVIDSAKEGDKGAIKIIDDFTDNLSTLIASVTNIIDPERIAIGGGVSMAGEFLYTPLKIKVKEKSFFKQEYDIVQAKTGNDAGIFGAAFL